MINKNYQYIFLKKIWKIKKWNKKHKFMNDFYETELGQKPGKRARAILDKHGDVSFDNLREHEAKVLEEAAAELEGEVQDVSKVVEPLIAEYENRAVRRHQSVLRCMAQERRGHET